MRKIDIPRIPSHGPNVQSIVQEGTKVGYIWILTDKGAGTIETQYASAPQIMEALGVSRATAYRIIARHPKRYWCSDTRDADAPRCYSVIPREALDAVTVLPLGNPNFANGIYQQDIARRRRKYTR